MGESMFAFTVHTIDDDGVKTDEALGPVEFSAPSVPAAKREAVRRAIEFADEDPETGFAEMMDAETRATRPRWKTISTTTYGAQMFEIHYQRDPERRARGVGAYILLGNI